MKTSQSEPKITPKFPIEVPTNTYAGSPACVYKVWFGKSYFIWKGKRLLQSAEILAESIERYIRLRKNEPENFIYHVCNHIKRVGCKKAKIEVIDSDFVPDGKVSAIDVYKMLKLEQALLKEATGDARCLNNNTQAYVAKWCQEDRPDDVDKFLRTWKK